MADRTWCQLRLAGILTVDGIAPLTEVLAALNPYGVNGPLKADAIENQLRTGDYEWEFDGIDEGKMPASLAEILAKLKLSHRWLHSWGDNYSSALHYRDARTGAEVEFSVIDERIGLTVNELRQPPRVAEALAWTEFDQAMELCVCRTHHALLAEQARGTLPEGYFELLGVTPRN